MEDLPVFIFFVHFEKYCLQRRWTEIPFIWVYSVLLKLMVVVVVVGYTGFTLSVYLSFCLSVRPSVGDMVSGA